MERVQTTDLFGMLLQTRVTTLEKENERLAIALAEVNSRLGRTAEIINALHERVKVLERDGHGHSL